MKLSEVRIEIEQSAKSLFGEKAYPITSHWIPVTDVLAIVDRFEKDWRREFETALSKSETCSHQELREVIRRVISDLLG